jgi:tRNA nucleotidyltransferase (CCA-adding enzyme)
VGAIDALASISFSKGKSLLEGVSPERVGQEVRKLLGGDFAADTLRIMDDMVSLQIIVPNWNDMKACKQNPKWHSEGNVSEHTLCVCDSMQKIEGHDWIDMACALLHDIGKPLSGKKNGKRHAEDEWLDAHDHDLVGKDVFMKTIPNEWRLTLKESSTIEDVILKHMEAHNIWKMNRVEQWKFLQNNNISRILNLLRSDCEGTTISIDYMSDFDRIKSLPDFNIFTAKKLPTPIVNGNTLIKNGIEPNRFFGGALEVAFNSQLRWIISHNFNDDFSKDDIDRFVKDAKEFIKAKIKANEK